MSDETMQFYIAGMVWTDNTTASLSFVVLGPYGKRSCWSAHGIVGVCRHIQSIVLKSAWRQFTLEVCMGHVPIFSAKF